MKLNPCKETFETISNDIWNWGFDNVSHSVRLRMQKEFISDLPWTTLRDILNDVYMKNKFFEGERNETHSFF
ncbi:hypothetical protein UFOVP787_74 [uncultured Caudovirales phage]|uniref:Uncharacterized protein n=1 Tax=uncultured Caudovirales phage TaxID=2100421 RepID=A0A6J5NUG0_9CAUD|nr:hypothetical protein UFOVP787_74 [uncultured Caudovirales phage]